jgi:hypothetical protein
MTTPRQGARGVAVRLVSSDLVRRTIPRWDFGCHLIRIFSGIATAAFGSVTVRIPS